jgi:hypothetical protein
MITAVVVDGPYANANAASDWDEFPEWTVSAVDDEGTDIGKIYRVRSYNRAVNLGEKIARDRRLELVNEAAPANGWGW